MKPRPQLGKFLAQAENGRASLYIYDQIGASWFSDGITAKQVVEAVDQAEKDGCTGLDVYINSPGGSVFEGIAIYSRLQRFKGEKVVYVDGIAASIASVIAMAGDRRCMGVGAMMMIHDASGVCAGNAAEMRETAERLDTICDAMVAAYAANTDLADDDIRAMMKAETWFTSASAIEKGFADELVEQAPGQDPSAFLRAPIFASFHNLPDRFKARLAPPPPAPTTPAPTDSDSKENSPMKALLAKLGLTDTATEAQALTAFDTVVGTSRKLIEITGAATEGQALGTVTAWKASHDRVTEMSAELTKIKADSAAAETKALVDGAIKDGKAAPAQRDALLTMSPESLKAFLAAAPVIHIKPAGTPKAELDSTTLTAEEMEVARKTNLDPAKFLEAKKKAIAEGRAPSAETLSMLATRAA
jgi:ATP-dependent Clp protease protease subunit